MIKKRCLFLVEGPTDRQRFSILQKLFDERELIIIPFQTDILTDKTYSRRYKTHINEILNKEKIYSYDSFDEIIQITDTDGCFLSDDLIQVDHSIDKIRYTTSTIICSDMGALLKQRENKRNNIKDILSKNIVRLYYVSTNAEHALDNIQNATVKQKRDLALKMYSNYSNNLGALVEKIKSIAPKCKSYKESWQFIMEGSNSLSPCSNLLFWLVENAAHMKEEYKELVLDCNL